MSSQFGKKCGGSSSGGSSGNNKLATMDPTESNFGLELKPTPKQTCIPEHQRHRLANSDTNVYQRNIGYDMPDKSWSVLYFGAGKDRAMK
ncbi:uncharacterized protein LOC108041955 [Drosophila rhopaloa]|uniref:Uncharacterized protein n=2 Tax=Drosophila rhopaloa TaxID=1041015 RepID=A0ABM5J1J6_DRORH|nr:uncharacterized protein LOC108041955 [Drosophila rhopaloa]